MKDYEIQGLWTTIYRCCRCTPVCSLGWVTAEPPDSYRGGSQGRERASEKCLNREILLAAPRAGVVVSTRSLGLCPSLLCIPGCLCSPFYLQPFPVPSPLSPSVCLACFSFLFCVLLVCSLYGPLPICMFYCVLFPVLFPLCCCLSQVLSSLYPAPLPHFPFLSLLILGFSFSVLVVLFPTLSFVPSFSITCQLSPASVSLPSSALLFALVVLLLLVLPICMSLSNGLCHCAIKPSVQLAHLFLSVPLSFSPSLDALLPSQPCCTLLSPFSSLSRSETPQSQCSGVLPLPAPSKNFSSPSLSPVAPAVFDFSQSFFPAP
ncbi:uncharacterized protein LOC121063654 [Cygnus olor]|uniref:uncharacterized protein LOC121063654 n=1 Tax=Cygnus olor TaxID=8869 RepID=UPI001ADE0175|nr:uncharacterized protein LOC121063654 [Cygnus olor]